MEGPELDLTPLFIRKSLVSQKKFKQLLPNISLVLYVLLKRTNSPMPEFYKTSEEALFFLALR